MKVSINNKFFEECDRRFSIVRNNFENDVNIYINDLIKNVFIKPSFHMLKPATILINNGNLEGWCWQTSTFLMPFFENGFITRGYLKYVCKGLYYHSWIEFSLNDIDYIYDPCLCFLCKKNVFYEQFEPKVISKISNEKVKKELLNILPKEKSIYIKGTDNPEDVFFRTNSKVKGNINGNKILSLKVHYYEEY